MIHINRLGEFGSSASSRSSSTKSNAPATPNPASPSAMLDSSKVADMVVSNPLISIGVGVTLGLVVGYLLKRRK